MDVLGGQEALANDKTSFLRAAILNLFRLKALTGTCQLLDFTLPLTMEK